MVSAAEQLAQNLNFSAFAKADELKKRLWFTLGALLVYRLGTYIPLPGIDPQALSDMVQQNQAGLLGMFNAFSGGAIGRMAIFALNIFPYISAAIIVQILTTVSPHLEQLKKEGETGRKQITARGVGNGISLIIFSGIVAGLPSALAGMLELGREGALPTAIILGVIVLAVVVIAFIVYMERAQRRLLIQYPKRQVGNRVFQGESSHLPLKLNTSGVIPPIFASSLLLVPATLTSFSAGTGPGWVTTMTSLLGHGQPLFMVIYAALIIFFAFFYTAIVFNPADTADNLKKHGGYIPGIRPGERTAEYIDYVLTRITVVGAIYLVIVCLLPEFLISATAVPFYFGGTSLLIVVSVTMDTVAQVQGHLLAHQYEGLVKKAKLRGRRR